MAFFKFRARGQKGDDPPASPAESIDDMRRRARHRLIGATVLVAIGVLGFPLLFDSQPRQVPVDIPIQIPDRDKTRAPGPATGRVAQAEPEPAPAPAAPTGPVAAGSSLGAKEEVVTDQAPPSAAPAPAPAPAAPPKAVSAPETTAKAAPPPEAKAPAKAPPAKMADDGARARALLEGRPATVVAAAPAAPTAEQSSRFVVQVGAFADADKARETRTRLERAGLKTYTQEVQTQEGRRIRVRVGPFAERAEAEKVAERVKGLNLPASVLTL